MESLWDIGGVVVLVELMVEPWDEPESADLQTGRKVSSRLARGGKKVSGGGRRTYFEREVLRFSGDVLGLTRALTLEMRDLLQVDCLGLVCWMGASAETSGPSG